MEFQLFYSPSNQISDSSSEWVIQPRSNKCIYYTNKKIIFVSFQHQVKVKVEIYIKIDKTI